MEHKTYHSVFGQREVVLGFCLLLTAAAAVGCTSKPANGDLGGTQSQLAASYCDAAAAMQASCSECHGAAPKYGAPMSLASYADLMAPAKTDPSKRVLDLIGLRIHDTQRPMPQPPFTLSAQGMAALDSFIAGGGQAPLDPTCGAAVGGGPTAGSSALAGTTGSIEVAGSGAAGSAGSAGVGTGTAGTGVPVAGTTGGTAGTTGSTDEDWPADCEEHYEFRAHAGTDMKTPYTVAAGQESHPQFFFAPPWGNDPVQALKFKPLTDNTTVLHHWILYGGSGGGGDPFLSGWAPGNDGGGPLPADVGMYMPSGSTQLRLDVHYNNSGSATTQLDNSGVEVCITRHFRANTATIIGLAASANSGAHQMVTNTQDCRASVTGGPAHLLSVSPHMHKLGVHTSLTFTPQGGAKQVLNDEPFSFMDQRIYPLNDVLVNNGDVLTTTCTYNNTTDNTVNFGESTSDEMCFNFTLYYPMGSLSCPPF